jgi:hypothetical protein
MQIDLQTLECTLDDLIINSEEGSRLLKYFKPVYMNTILLKKLSPLFKQSNSTN